ncbi:nitroreductase family protein [Microlunatus parietis]|uniref:Nitroreductase n=1 Tax=Microlunatus parietis TaxID=682979 RepID=A0A7Y9LE74_9ACTN|nr:nitroreductase family protein [Microlunatus parietis]NYE73543.1 nitroreductase [Microlunatus parietis]
MGERPAYTPRAVRTFEPDLVPFPTIRQLIDRARWTGSARNGQPWRFAAVRDSAVQDQLSRLGDYAALLRDAPAVLVLLSPTAERRDTAFDLGRVAQSITIAADEAGLGSCVVSLYPEANADRAARLVGAEPGWSAHHAIALGRPRPAPRGRSAIPVGRRPTADLLRLVGAWPD